MRAGQLPIQQQLAHLRAAWRRNRTLTDVLARAAGMDLPGWYLVAGCLYQTVWNVVTGQPPEAGILDYDLAYFDDSDLSWDAEDAVIKAGNEIFAGLPAPVQIRNQARVHLWYEQKFGVPCPPHASTEAAIDTFEATAACLGAGRGPSGRWRIYAPYGLADMFNLVVRPNPVLAPRHVYQAKAARWRQQWPGLTVLPWPEPPASPASAPGTTPRAVSSPRRPCAAWAHQPGSVASRPSQGSSLGASSISYSTVPCSRRTRSALALRSSAAMAALSAETSAVKRWMPSARARPDSWASSSVPSPRPCQSSAMVTAISAACGSPVSRT